MVLPGGAGRLQLCTLCAMAQQAVRRLPHLPGTRAGKSLQHLLALTARQQVAERERQLIAIGPLQPFRDGASSGPCAQLCGSALYRPAAGKWVRTRVWHA